MSETGEVGDTADRPRAVESRGGTALPVQPHISGWERARRVAASSSAVAGGRTSEDFPARVLPHPHFGPRASRTCSMDAGFRIGGVFPGASGGIYSDAARIWGSTVDFVARGL